MSQKKSLAESTRKSGETERNISEIGGGPGEGDKSLCVCTQQIPLPSFFAKNFLQYYTPIPLLSRVRRKKILIKKHSLFFLRMRKEGGRQKKVCSVFLCR